MRKLFFGTSFLALACIVLLSLLTSTPAESREVVCNSCNGTGRSRFGYDSPPEYSGCSVQKEYCEICGAYKKVHVHRICTLCQGLGTITLPDNNRNQNTYPNYGSYNYGGY